MYTYTYIYIYMYLYFLCKSICDPLFKEISVCAMRHAHRRPELVVCGLLRLTSFWKLQNVLKSFEVSVCYYIFWKFFPSSLEAFGLSLVPDGLAECKTSASIN